MIEVPIWYFILWLVYVVMCQTLLSYEIGRELKLWELERKRLRHNFINPHKKTTPRQNQDSYNPVHPAPYIQIVQESNKRRTDNPSHNEHKGFPFMAHVNNLIQKLKQSIRRSN
jgi:hypothetical protein